MCAATSAHVSPVLSLPQPPMVQAVSGVPVIHIVDTGGRGHPLWPSPCQSDSAGEIGRPLQVLDFVHDRVVWGSKRGSQSAGGNKPFARNRNGR